MMPEGTAQMSGGAAAGGGRSEVKRSRAGPTHGEPRTESPSEAAQPEEGPAQRLPALAALLLIFLLAGGCGRAPKIIVLKDPLTAAEHVELGVAYERKGELDLAQREYDRALRKDGKFFQARVNLGNVFLAKKEYGKARKEYLRALDLRPGNAEATNNLGWTAISSGEGIGDALARMEAVVAGPSGRQAALLDTLGVLRVRADRPEAADEAFALAEELCGKADAVPREGAQDGSPCTAEVRREIGEHRRELRRRFPSPAAPALVE
jgi:Tfp pilus assembly protein PilF